jgi:hypothetical protein
VVNIPLTQGQFVLVDDNDFERVNAFKWHAAYFEAQRSFYAKRAVWRDGKYRTLFLHRFLMGEPQGMEVDHRNGDTLDCRRKNLRVATKAQNRRNQGKNIKNKSGYKGVWWNKRCGAWRAEISIDDIGKNLGHFASLVDAARAYDRGARLYHGPFARLNFPEPGEMSAIDIIPLIGQREFCFQ